MKTGMVLILTLVLMAAMAVTNAIAVEAVPVEERVEEPALVEARYHAPLGTQEGDYFPRIAFAGSGTLISMGPDGYLREWDVPPGGQRWSSRNSMDTEWRGGGIAIASGPDWTSNWVAYTRNMHGAPLGGVIRMRHILDFEGRQHFGDLRDGDWRGHANGHKGTVCSLAFKPNSYVLAIGGYDNNISIWDVGDKDDLRKRMVLPGHTDSVLSVRWSPDGRTLASTGADGTVRLWNDSGMNVAVLWGHTGRVLDVAWSPDGRTLVSGGSDGTIRLWDPDTHGTLRVLRLDDFVMSLAFHPNGQTLASGGGEIHFWDPNTGAEKTRLSVSSGGTVTELAFSPNGQTLAFAEAVEVLQGLYHGYLTLVDVNVD